ncbi:hypothetical protein [uncultured Draconibacterium sp.]|uniref:GumK N-terminal domain-containing glycosyltransferase n=1 Tax=uncultured Draconibacterium sp. TaxID=1573823 RepID=UPI0025EE0EC0|nr:hypothetical protein [uncultured Draconibacterium sp.]
MNKKIVFLTYHNWEAKRQGGFHKFAEHSAKVGYNTVFFSFPRQFWTLFRKTDTFNYKKIVKLLRGVFYEINDHSLFNGTVLSLGLPIPPRYFKYFPASILNFFERITIPGLGRYATQHFSNAEYFVFESTASVLLYNSIKKLFPNSKIIYRPSDPLIAFDYGKRFRKQELELLKNADLVLLVNKDGLELYKKEFTNFEALVNYKIISNGVDIKQFKHKYPKPKQLNIPNTVLYVGARPIDWEMLLAASKKSKVINFIIVCPLEIPRTFQESYKKQDNIIHIKGIERSSVPQWITNADVIMVPNPRYWYERYPWGITAKYYQAIAAQKPIVSYHDTEELKDLNIPVTFDSDTFISEIENALQKKRINYPFDLKQKDWSYVCNSFIEAIESI